MSVVSGTKPNKAASVVSSHRNGTLIDNSKSTAVPGSNSTLSKSRATPFNALTIPSSVTKGKILGDQEMTEEELEHLADVCRRSEMLQRKEDERIK
ncbi:unnamed protein product [Mesocestoides corti]|nr:unnamed protein product [Mesocestoides corti]